MPKLFEVMVISTSAIAMSAGTSGSISGPCIRSSTRLSWAPSLPPGWNTWKSSEPKPRSSITATARASPSARVSVVEVVGARPIGQASGSFGRVSLKSAACISVLFGFDEIPIIGIENRRVCSRMSRSSAVSPELEISRQTSCRVIMPRSPWLASEACTK